MSRKKKSAKVRVLPTKKLARRPSQATSLASRRFDEVLKLIEAARGRAYQAVNTELVSREFYLLAAIRERWSKRELERQIVTGAALRSDTRTKKVSPAVSQTHPTAIDELKDAYSLEFLSLPSDHTEDDLHAALLRNLGRFITELGRDFCFVGSEYPVQVGNQDFAIDLVFFHRGLSCLVAFELKVRKIRASGPRPAELLRRGARPRRKEAPRAPLDRRPEDEGGLRREIARNSPGALRVDVG